MYLNSQITINTLNPVWLTELIWQQAITPISPLHQMQLIIQGMIDVWSFLFVFCTRAMRDFFMASSLCKLHVQIITQYLNHSKDIISLNIWHLNSCIK